MTTTMTVNCGCGFRVTGDNNQPMENRTTQVKITIAPLVAAQQHCAETGHTMDIIGMVQP